MSFSQRLQWVAQDPDSFKRIGRGLERETLRITPQGKISQKPHPIALGSALTNKWITTDFSESLLEFITPVSFDVATLLGQLTDIHKFAQSQLDGETLWPFSMPCPIDKDTDIPLAQYGCSNVGRMKTLYREGLKRRYGSMMQVISGVHFNFSFPEAFWTQLFGDVQGEERQEKISDAYFGLIRNYYRFGWLIPFLFGASPALCREFLQDKTAPLPFETLGADTLYLPQATSLRLSDLGYTNQAQNAFRIGFNGLSEYLDGLETAMQTPSQAFADIGVKVDGEFRQLNSNVLQIENELYAPIRAKRVTQSGEKPSCALKRAGVEYIEVRSLDINPLSPIGISEDQVRFLDLFLVWATLSDSAPMTDCELDCWRQNWKKVVVSGRDLDLMLTIGCQGEQLTLREWALRVFDELAQVAEMMDTAHGNHAYQATCERLREWVETPSRSLSGQIWQKMIEAGEMFDLGQRLSQQHQAELVKSEYQYFFPEQFEIERDRSLHAQVELEAQDRISFEAYLQSYFSPSE